MKKIILIALYLFALTVYSQNPTPFDNSIRVKNLATQSGTPDIAVFDSNKVLKKIAWSSLPDGSSSVLEYANFAAFPGTGTVAKIYVDKATNIIYRWSGSAYVILSPFTTPTLQQVLNTGFSATGTNGDINLDITSGNIGFEATYDINSSAFFLSPTQISFGQFLGLKGFEIGANNGSLYLSQGNSDGTKFTDILIEEPVSTNTALKFPAKSVSGTYILATTDQIHTIDANPTDGSNNAVSGNGVFDALALKSNLASPTFTGVITTPEIALTSTTKGFLPNSVTTTQRNAISSPTAGTMIFNTTEGYPEYFDTFWGWMPLYTSNEWKAKNGIEYFNDITTTIGGDGMLTAGTASGTISYTSSAISNRLGLGVLSTSTSATGRAWIGQGVSGTATIMRMGGGRIIHETSVRIPTLSDGTQRFQFLSGLSSTNNGTSISNGVLFAYDEGGVSTGSSASANWQVATMSGSSRTWTTTSVPVVSGEFYKLTIEINDACTSVVFKINGTTVRTETLTLPSATDIGLMTQIYKSIGTTARTAEIDYISFKQKFTTPR